jgi:hypothetical protein
VNRNARRKILVEKIFNKCKIILDHHGVNWLTLYKVDASRPSHTMKTAACPPLANRSSEEGQAGSRQLTGFPAGGAVGRAGRMDFPAAPALVTRRNEKQDRR